MQLRLRGLEDSFGRTYYVVSRHNGRWQGVVYKVFFLRGQKFSVVEAVMPPVDSQYGCEAALVTHSLLLRGTP
jgi:hypothetical protein